MALELAAKATSTEQLNSRNMQRKEKTGISSVFVFAVFLAAAWVRYIPLPNSFISVFYNIVLRCTRNEL